LPFTLKFNDLDTICQTCTYAVMYERRGGSVTVICTETSPSMVVPLDIVKCSDHTDRNTPRKYDLEKIAWMVSADKKGRFIGFARPVEDKD
jgi:hypothetical protein